MENDGVEKSSARLRDGSLGDAAGRVWASRRWSVLLTWLGTRIRPLAGMSSTVRDETVPGSLLVSFTMALVPFAHVRVFPDADVFWGCQRGGVRRICVRRDDDGEREGEGETEVGEGMI